VVAKKEGFTRISFTSTKRTKKKQIYLDEVGPTHVYLGKGEDENDFKRFGNGRDQTNSP